MTPEESRFRERRSAYTDDDAGEGPAQPRPDAGDARAEPEPVVETPSGGPAAAGEAMPAGADAPADGSPAAGPPPASGPAPAEGDLDRDLERLDRMEIPDPSFLEIVQPLEFQALQFLGLAPLTESGEKRVLPRWAKHVIDLLGLLEERTRGNLPEDEAKYLEGVLSELRVQYMKVTS